MSLLIGADFVPTESNIDLFKAGNVRELFGEELLAVIEKADFRIFNLETPLADKKTPISKCGPNLIASTESIPGFIASKVDLFTIANNHILDQGVQGLNSTCRTLSNHGIAYVGVGSNLVETQKTYVFLHQGKKIGVYACVEHEFSVATENRPGANPFDPLESFDHVNELSDECDYTIVLYHGGKEHYRYPSPCLQKICRKFADKGADLIVCQHSHCLGCREEYKQGTIVYGQGNFLFDRSTNEMWNTGVLIRIEDDYSISYIPIIRQENKVRLANNKQKEEILKGFEERSAEILRDGFISKKYIEFAKDNISWYFYSIGGTWRSAIFRIYRKIIKKNPDIRKCYSKKRIIEIINCIEDEAHFELLLTGLKHSIDGDED